MRTWFAVTIGSGTSSTTMCLSPLRSSCFIDNVEEAICQLRESLCLSLEHTRRSPFDGVDVGSQIFAVASRATAAAVGPDVIILDLVIPNALKVNCADILKGDIALGPAFAAHDGVIGELIAREATVKHTRWTLALRLIGAIRSAASRCYLVCPRAHEVVGENKIGDLRARRRGANIEQHIGSERGVVVDGHVVQRRYLNDYCGEGAEALIGRWIDIFKNVVMDAVAAAIRGSAAAVRADIGNHKPARHVHDAVIANGHVRDAAQRTDVWALILWRQQDGESILTEASPGVFHHIAFQQNSLSIFQFKVILHDERVTIASSYEIGLFRLPVHRPEHVIAPQLDIGGDQRRWSTAKDNVFRRCLEKIIDDLVGPHRIIPVAAADGLRIGAGAGLRDAVEVGEERIYNRNVGTASQLDTPGSFLLSESMDPHAIKDQMVSRRLGRQRN